MRKGDEEPTLPDSNLDYVDYWPTNTGHIVQLNSQKGRPRKRGPLGFAKDRHKRKSAGRVPGTFPDVPRFDLRGDEE